MKIRVLLAFIAITFIQLPSSFAETLPTKALDVCATEKSVNCIESVRATFPDGRTLSAERTGRTSNVTCNVSGALQSTCIFIEWEVKGLLNEDGRNLIQTTGWFQPPNSGPSNDLPPGGLLFFVSASGWDGKTQNVSTGVCAAGNPNNFNCRRSSFLQQAVKFAVSIRTKDFTPAWTTGTLINFDVNYRKYPSYTLLTYSGEAGDTAGLIRNWNSDGSAPEQNDYESYLWSIRTINIDDYWAQPVRAHGCYSTNPVMMTNSLWVGLPKFDPESQSIELSVSNPHLLSNGTVAIGRFESNFPAAFTECFWGKTPKEVGNRVQLEISYPDAVSNLATLATQVDEGTLKISASGYHYSSPTLKLSLQKSVPSPIPAKLLKCAKGKQIKIVKVSKCPAGYKTISK